jgi:hypothetical protein
VIKTQNTLNLTTHPVLYGLLLQVIKTQMPKWPYQKNKKIKAQPEPLRVQNISTFLSFIAQLGTI